MGRPQEVCQIFLDSSLVDSNQSRIEGIRSHLLVGGAFEVTPGVPHLSQIELSCNSQGARGFSTMLFYPPVLAHFYPGMILQLVRGISDLVLGPVCSIIFLASLLLASSRQKKNLNVGPAVYFFLFQLSCMLFLFLILQVYLFVITAPISTFLFEYYSPCLFYPFAQVDLRLKVSYSLRISFV